MKRIIQVGRPVHFSIKGKRACGYVGPAHAAYDPRDVECLRCRKTKALRAALYGKGE